jgi:hydrogenase large subunit
VTNYLSAPDFPRDTKGTDFGMPGGYIPNGDLSQFHQITSFGDPYFEQNVKESIKHSWYDGRLDAHPYEEETEPEYTDFNETAPIPGSRRRPSYDQAGAGRPAGQCAGHGTSRRARADQAYLKIAMDRIGAITGSEVPLSVLHSSLGRHAARCVRTQVLYDMMQENYDALIANIASGDYTASTSRSSRRAQMGFGFHEAPRGILSHWVVIEDGKIKNYQAWCRRPGTPARATRTTPADPTRHR